MALPSANKQPTNKPSRRFSLDEQGQHWLEVDKAFLVWLQNKARTGYIGFEVWTPARGKIATVRAEGQE